MSEQQPGIPVGYVWVEYDGDGTLSGYLGSDTLHLHRDDSAGEKAELDQIAGRAGLGDRYELAAVIPLTSTPPDTRPYTSAAVSAVTTAARSEHDFAGWLAAVLCAAAARLGSSQALTAGRQGSWEAGLVQHLVCGTAGWDDEHLDGYATFGEKTDSMGGCDSGGPVTASIDTAFFHAVAPFDGQPDDPDGSDEAAATVEVSAPRWDGSRPEGWDVRVDISRTNIRLDLAAGQARRLASSLIRAAADSEATR